MPIVRAAAASPAAIFLMDIFFADQPLLLRPAGDCAAGELMEFFMLELPLVVGAVGGQTRSPCSRLAAGPSIRKRLCRTTWKILGTLGGPSRSNRCRSTKAMGRPFTVPWP